MRRIGLSGRRRALGVVLPAVLAAGIAGCGGLTDTGGDNLIAGKEAFVQKCGSCHTLARAGTTGVSGPNLDVAFRQSRRDGLKETTFEGVVYRQILEPARDKQVDPRTGRETLLMPANLVTGDAAQDVAAYVASAAAKPGKDTGVLGTIGVQRSDRTAQAENGELDIPADPGGGLAYTFANAEAEAGAVKIISKNDSSVDHNIAIQGQGVDEKGPVVKNGATSEVDVDLEAGEYTFYCSVPGHRQGGMEGKLTVK
jgi:plastocyanin